MTYYLGVDLGTTYTAAAVWRDGQVEVANLGNRAAVIPSLLLLRDDGSMLVGEAAERRAPVEPQRVAREFKRRLGDPTPIIIGGTPYSADALMAKLLRWVVDKVTSTEGGPPAGVAVSHPANWGAFKKDLFSQAIALADLQGVATVTEPEAAAIHYASQERIEPGAVIAVYDLGGGTFDAAVLRKTATGWEILGDPQGIERLGGVDFDEAVFQHVVAATGDAVVTLDPDDPAALAAVARLRHECITAKEALSDDTDVSIPVFLPTLQTEVRLTRNELETMVRPALTNSIAALDRALRAAHVKADDITTVLLVGGSSRLPLVSGLVGGEMGRPVAVDAHPKYSVALGAAIVAAGRDVANAVEASRVGAIPEETDTRPPPPPPVAGLGAVVLPPPPGSTPPGGSAPPQQVASTLGAPLGPPPGGPAPPAPPGSTPPGGSLPRPPGPPPPGSTLAPPGPSGPGAPPLSTTPAAAWHQAGPPPPVSGPYAPAPGRPGGPGGGSRAGLWAALGGIAAVGVLVVALIVTLGGDDGNGPNGSSTTTSQQSSSSLGSSSVTTGSTSSMTSGSSTSATSASSGVPEGCTRGESECVTLLQGCAGGDMAVCDTLWGATGSNSEAEAVAESCGGLDPGGEHNGTCTTDYPNGGPAELPAGCSGSLATPEECAVHYAGCAGGGMATCDELWFDASVGSALETFAEECGGRDPGNTTHGHCESEFGST